MPHRQRSFSESLRYALLKITERIRFSLAATLPEEYEEDTIGGMKVGDRGYAAPWAMCVTEDGRCAINPDQALHAQPGGTIQMLVERTDAGFRVHPPKGYRYSRRRGRWLNAVPVVEVCS